MSNWNTYAENTQYRHISQEEMEDARNYKISQMEKAFPSQKIILIDNPADQEECETLTDWNDHQQVRIIGKKYTNDALYHSMVNELTKLRSAYKEDDISRKNVLLTTFQKLYSVRFNY